MTPRLRLLASAALLATAQQTHAASLREHVLFGLNPINTISTSPPTTPPLKPINTLQTPPSLAPTLPLAPPPTFPPTTTSLSGCLVPFFTGYGGYSSPYHLSPAVCDPALTPDFRAGLKLASNYAHWSATPYEQWTDLAAMTALNSSWGPWYVAFPAPPHVLQLSLLEQQARVLAATTYHLGSFPYRHFHMAEVVVMPAPGWLDAFPGRSGAGLDCSDYSHFNFNMALGVQLKTATGVQAAQRTANLVVGGAPTSVTVQGTVLFDVQAGWEPDFSELVAGLQPGDLLYIRGDPDPSRPITHVIMWVSPLANDTLGQDPYLITDSFGDVSVDSRGNQIPSGPQLRPFREDTYYWSSFDHVVRWLPLTVVS